VDFFPPPCENHSCLQCNNMKGGVCGGEKKNLFERVEVRERARVCYVSCVRDKQSERRKKRGT
jgi:hypothetical protein